MKIILANGTELQPRIVTGGPEYTHGSTRDVLTFVFTDMSLDELDSLFTEVNCESIRIIGDDESEAIHNGYVVRSGLEKKSEEVEQATTDTEPVYEQREYVKMAQRTYTETQLASLTETVDVLVMESLLA